MQALGWAHANLIWLVLGSYAVAALAPSPGLWLRSVAFGHIVAFSDKTPVTLPMLLLALLLFNAGLGFRLDAMGGWWRNLGILLVGVLANVLIPLIFLYLISRLNLFWPSSPNLEHLVMGLALIASMPVAGSSTAWAQNANGDMSLSLGLVLLSTSLSPLTTPMALHLAGGMAIGEYAASLHRLAQLGTGTFMFAFVLLPSIAGVCIAIIVGVTRGASKLDRLKPSLKASNIASLLLLNYSNASISLPQLVASPEIAYVAAMLFTAGLLCGSAFFAAAVIARLLGVPREKRVSLMFALGMNNNGTGLVLASSALPAHPAVMLPIIAYNLIQHVVAGGVYTFLRPRAPS
jgi:BASS family bile acid:Na+ symporter